VSRRLDIEFYLQAAEKHGRESDPDHEIGDLQQFLRAMWRLLSAEQKHAFANHPDVRLALDGAFVEYEEHL
jgi:hypothetical protein